MSADFDISVLSLILDASLVVQLVMFLLLVASLLSWTVILVKWGALKQARSHATGFERRFWSGVELSDLFKKLTSSQRKLGGMETIFESGFREFVRLRKKPGIHADSILQGSQRAMRVALSREIDNLEMHLSFLATVGSTSPYIGLFGTVWGIMNSFMALGGQQHVTIATVAPGIAEALIATAMGLFAAIPAVITYNRFSNDVERLINSYDTFLEEFSSILHRQVDH